MRLASCSRSVPSSVRWYPRLRSTSSPGSAVSRRTGSCSSASASPRCSAAVTSYLLTRAEIYEAQRAAVWLTGSLNGRSWEHVEPLACSMLVLFPATIALTRSAASAAARRRHRQGTRRPVEWLAARCMLVGVALAGRSPPRRPDPIAFVAFVAAPIARRLVNAPLTMIPAALVGALSCCCCPTSLAAECSRRPSCPSASSPGSSVRRT